MGRLGRENAEPFFSWRRISYAIVDRARRAIAALLRDRLRGGGRLCPGYTDLVLWREGRGMNAHRDNLAPHFEHRLCSSILCLTECEGGATVFPDPGIEVPPETGKMIACPSSMAHGVSPVAAGMRRTLASWYTAEFGRGEP
ncbi:MAG: 2OG-Fe(II) oxygenase [Rhodospirillales bacterium]|nr:2OG-Fe(II) oxygenase [Rhodospirillales bacterium]